MVFTKTVFFKFFLKTVLLAWFSPPLSLSLYRESYVRVRTYSITRHVKKISLFSFFVCNEVFSPVFPLFPLVYIEHDTEYTKQASSHNPKILFFDLGKWQQPGKYKRASTTNG